MDFSHKERKHWNDHIENKKVPKKIILITYARLFIKKELCVHKLENAKSLRSPKIE